MYYTLDGSSPTDESARMKYSSPIVLTEDVTVKAMAVKDGMDDSDVATFVYAVTGIKGVVTDGIEEDTPIYNVSGQRLNKTRKGINIIGRKKVMMK